MVGLNWESVILKKKVAGTILGLVAALFIFVGGVYAGVNIEWDGTPHFENTSENHNTLGDKIRSLFDERDDLVLDKAKLEADKKELEDERDDLVAERERIIKEFNDTKGEDEETINSLDDLIDGLNGQIDGLNDQIISLNEDIETKDGEIATLTEEGEEKDATITSLEADKTALTNRVSELETDLTAEKDKYTKDFNAAKELVVRVIGQVNNTNGKGPRYEVLKENVNHVASYFGLVATEQINDNPGNGPQDDKLEQALKDIQVLEQETIDLLKIFETHEGAEVEPTDK